MFETRNKQYINTDKIRGLMAENGENINDLSRLLNIHRNTVSLKLNKKREFSASELKKISDHYGVLINIFFN